MKNQKSLQQMLAIVKQRGGKCIYTGKKILKPAIVKISKSNVTPKNKI